MTKQDRDNNDLRKLLIESNDDGRFHLCDEARSIFFKNTLSCSHINMLLGAGFSISTTPALGYREQWSDNLKNANLGTAGIAEKVLALEFFQQILSSMPAQSSDKNQQRLCRALKTIIQNRGTTTIPRRACVFTTNYDSSVELSLEAIHCSYNDGFEGRDCPRFATRSFSRLQYTQSLSMEYASQVPTINVVKLHGSVTWKKDPNDNKTILYSDFKSQIDNFTKRHTSLLEDKAINNAFSLFDKKPTDSLVTQLFDLLDNLNNEIVESLNQFYDDYAQSFCLVNPTKKKFEDTVLGLTYYELLRLYANELDRNNSLLIVFGFSFADEHIAEITKRALENPQLLVVVCCYSEDDYRRCFAMFETEQNVCFIVADNSHVTLNALCDLFEDAVQ